MGEGKNTVTKPKILQRRRGGKNKRIGHIYQLYPACFLLASTGIQFKTKTVSMATEPTNVKPE